MDEQAADPSSWRQNPGATTTSFRGTGGHGDSGLLATLRVTDPQANKARIESIKGGLLGDCYHWILEHPDFQQWRDEPGAHQLWVKGDAGKGKTMLLCGIINELQKLDANSHNVIYFFCEATNSTHNNALGALRNLMYFLLIKQPDLVRHVRGEYELSKERMCEGEDAWFSLSTIFSKMLRDPALRQTFIVLDALDECENELGKLLALVESLHQFDRAKVLVSSRNRPDIQEVLEAAPDKVRICLELNHDAISAAVSTYINTKVDQLAKQKRYDTATRDKVLQHLITNSNNTFLWVALVSQALSVRSIQRWHIKKVLDTFPAGLSQLYERMAERLSSEVDFDLCRQVIAAVYSAYRPLNLHELGTLIEPLEGFYNDAESLELIVGTCQSFLSLRNRIVYFVHQSAKDFVNEKIKGQIIPLGLHSQHQLMALKSLETLDKMLRRDMKTSSNQVLSPEQASTSETDPLLSLSYACVFWVDHLHEGSGFEAILEDDGLIYKFLKCKFLNWIEVLARLSSLSEGIQAMRGLQGLMALALESSSDRTRLMVKDGLRFLLSSKGGIELDPMQVYSSALIFSPRGSLVRQTYEDQECPSWILSKPLVDENWDNRLQTIETHGGNVTHLVFLPPHGQTLVSASSDGLIKMWTVATGACLRTMHNNRRDSSVRPVPCLATLGSDGTRLVSGSDGGDISVWDTATGRRAKLLQGHESEVSATTSSDGTRLVSASEDGTARIWDAATGDCLRVLNIGKKVWGVALSPNGQRLALVTRWDRHSVQIWDSTTGEHLHTLNSKFAIIYVKFLSDGAWLLAICENESFAWAMATCKRWRLPGEFDWIYGTVAMSPDERLFAYQENNHTVWVQSSQHIYPVKRLGKIVQSLAFSPDSALLAAGQEDGTIQIWDMDTSGHVEKFVESARPSKGSEADKYADEALPFILSPANRTSSASSNTLDATIRGVVLSPDEALVASWSMDNVKIWDASTNVCIRTLNFENPDIVAFSPDGTCIAVAVDQAVRMLPVVGSDSWELIGRHGGNIRSLAFSPNGCLLASLSEPPSEWHRHDYLVKTWHVATHDCLYTLRLKKYTYPGRLVFSIDSSLLLFYNGGTFTVWKMVDGTHLYTADTHHAHFSWLPINTLHLDLVSNKFEFRTHAWSRQDDSGLFRPGSFYGFDGIPSHDSFKLNISSDRAWIVSQGEPVLWLPPEHRPESLALAGTTLAIGCNSDRVFCIKFSLDSPL